MSASVNELKVLLHLENNLDSSVLDFFDPLIYLYNSPVFITDSFRESVNKLYIEKIRKLNMVDIYFLRKLNSEVEYKNDILEQSLNCDYVKNRMELLEVLGGVDDCLSQMTAIEYFTKFPFGRCLV
ncbi:MAG: hypothetical protein ABIK31_00355 [candidate division WOR-3 bacterium]